MIRTNHFLIKLLVSILIVLTLVNFISSTRIEPNFCYAGEETSAGEEKTGGLISGILSGIGNAIVNAIKSVVLALPRAMRSINYSLAASAGVNYEGSTTVNEISPFDIFFNRFALLDANIFSTSYRNGTPLPEDSVVYKIRTNTAIWYYGIRGLSILVITVMLFVNIFKALSGSSSPDQKSKAKNSITDWVLSFALVMFMHIIIIVVLSLNDVVLSAIEAFMGEAANTKDFFDALENAVFSTNLILGIATLIVYFVLNWQTFKYILKYIQRLLTIVLLIMIAPIIPVSYSLDRMKHGKNGGTVLNNWLKELIFNVFIQSLHALIYAALIGVAMNALTSTSSVTGIGDLANALVAVGAMLFIKHAENLLKSILGFDKSQVLNSNVFSEAASTVRNVSNSIRTRVNPAAASATTTPFGQNVGQSAGGQGARSLFKNPLGGNAQSGGMRQNTSTLLGGIRNIATGSDGAVDVTNGSDGQNGRDGEAVAEASAEATATIEEDGVAPIIVDGSDEESKDKQKTTDMLQDERVDDLQQSVDESLSEEDQKKRELDELIKNLDESQTTKNETTEETDENIEEKFVENETETTDEVEDIEENEETDENIGEGGLDDESIKKIVNQLKEKITPELADRITEVLTNDIKPELLEALNAITSDDNGKLEEIRSDLTGELSNQMNNIGFEMAEQIEGEIDSKLDSPDELQDYLSSLPENSNEKAYAETYAKLSTIDKIYNNSNMSTKEKVETVLDTNNALETKADGGTADIKTADIKTAGNARTMQAVNEAMNTNTVSETGEEHSIEMKPDPDIDKLKDGPVKEMMVELSEIDPVKYRVHGKAEGELTEEIQTDFEANIEHFTEKMGRTPEGLNDIYKSMDREAQRQFAEYSKGELNPKDLKGDAKALATLQIQASRLGYAMQAENEYQYTINRGEMRTSATTQGVITDLARHREQREEEARRQKGKHSA